MHKCKMVIAILIYFSFAIPLGVIATLFQEVCLIHDALHDDIDETYYGNIQSKFADLVDELLSGIGRFFGLE